MQGRCCQNRRPIQAEHPPRSRGRGKSQTPTLQDGLQTPHSARSRQRQRTWCHRSHASPRRTLLSLLASWRQEREAGIQDALSPHKRGPKSKHDPLILENQKLTRENQRLTEKLRTAEIIIDVQKKVAMLLGHPISNPDQEANL